MTLESYQSKYTKEEQKELEANIKKKWKREEKIEEKNIKTKEKKEEKESKKIKKAKEKEWKKTKKYLGKRLSKTRRVFRKDKARLHVNLGDANYRAPSVLGDENRFFTGNYEQEKRSMFFS